MAGAHSAAGGDVVGDEFPVLDDGNEAEVLRINIHVIERRDGDGNLELRGR